MNSKKFLAFAMAAAMTLSMTACGGSGSGAASSGTDSAAGTAFKLGGTGPPPEGPPSMAWPPSGALRSPWTRSMPRAAPSSST